jgi:hypothetical protein
VVHLSKERKFLFLDEKGNRVGLSDTLMMYSYAITSTGDVWAIGGRGLGRMHGHLYAYYIDRGGKTLFKIDLGEVNPPVYMFDGEASRQGEYAAFNFRSRLFVVQKNPPVLKAVIVSEKADQRFKEMFYQVRMSPSGQYIVAIFLTESAGYRLRVYGLDGSLQDEIEIPGGKIADVMDGEYFAFFRDREINLYKVESR